jgi:predicted TIM-barrel fold metal-dependent hydrolase
MERHEIIDAHMHLWNYEENPYPWLREVRDFWFGDYTSLRRNYLLEHYLKDCAGQGVTRSVHVQAQWDHSDPVGETRWLKSITDRHGYPHAIVAYCDLRKPDARQVLEAQLEYEPVRGIRMDINWHENPRYRFFEDREVMKNPAWLSGLSLLAEYGLSFDLQIYAAEQIGDAYDVVRRFENIQFILDHAGAPADRTPEGVARWERALARLAELPNIVTKLSGFDMFDQQWTDRSLGSMVHRVIDRFGPGRCLFGSNFPVSRLYRSYGELVGAYERILSGFSCSERHAIFAGNAARYYRIAP